MTNSDIFTNEQSADIQNFAGLQGLRGLQAKSTGMALTHIVWTIQIVSSSSENSKI
jgi:hypothetical protein